MKIPIAGLIPYAIRFYKHTGSINPIFIYKSYRRYLGFLKEVENYKPED